MNTGASERSGANAANPIVGGGGSVKTSEIRLLIADTENRDFTSNDPKEPTVTRTGTVSTEETLIEFIVSGVVHPEKRTA